eukprot:gene9309-6548_t
MTDYPAQTIRSSSHGSAFQERSGIWGLHQASARQDAAKPTRMVKAPKGATSFSLPHNTICQPAGVPHSLPSPSPWPRDAMLLYHALSFSRISVRRCIVYYTSLSLAIAP